MTGGLGQTVQGIFLTLMHFIWTLGVHFSKMTPAIGYFSGPIIYIYLVCLIYSCWTTTFNICLFSNASKSTYVFFSIAASLVNRDRDTNKYSERNHGTHLSKIETRLWYFYVLFYLQYFLPFKRCLWYAHIILIWYSVKETIDNIIMLSLRPAGGL